MHLRKILSARGVCFWLLVAAFVCCASRRPALAQMHNGQQLVKADLLAEADGIKVGEPFTVALHLQIAPGWHTYWKYSGDSGMPTRIDWQLPPGFRAEEIKWPIPRRIVEEGDLWSYAYPDETLLFVKVTPPARIAEKQVVLRAKASWLVCEKICIPGNASLALTLPVLPASQNPKPNEANAPLFLKYRALLPKSADECPFGARVDWSASGHFVVNVSGAPADARLDLFPLPDAALQVGHVETSKSENPGGLIFKIPVDAKSLALAAKENKPHAVSAVLVAQNADGSPVNGWLLNAPTDSPVFSKQAAQPAQITQTETEQPRANANMNAASNAHEKKSLPGFLLFGFLGGLILNVMPCVLPVIALKIFGFIKQAGESPRRIVALGLAFVAGIFAWFFALAALIVFFKMAGRELNWAFQFQHPLFLVAMIVIIGAFALNLLGVFEIVLPGRAQNRVVDLASREGLGGAFLHGVFATLMATPCTAPFLGPALGFALAQSPLIVCAMFAAIAAGMSAPYLLLTLRPSWVRFLPKPGLWMMRVKQALGVLLLGTVAWLGWILFAQQKAAAREAHEQPFAAQLENALSQRRVVFVDFTADWCVNCKVNERLVLDTEPVQRAFRERHVFFLKADWTNGDAAITKLLKQFDRAGVPLYVVYPPDLSKAAPIVLPEVITKQTVLDALDAANRVAK